MSDDTALVEGKFKAAKDNEDEDEDEDEEAHSEEDEEENEPRSRITFANWDGA